MKISAKTRLICLIVALVFAFGGLIGTGTYLIINHINNLKALNNETDTSTNSYIGNMISSTNNSLVDYNTYSALMTKLGNDTTSTRNKTNINGGTPVVFQMGTVNGNPVYWEVVYQTGDTITVWMTQPYTTGQFNPYDTDGSYLYNGNYSSSYLRQSTQAIYNELNAAYPVFSKVVKSPSNAGVSSWQSSQSNAKYTSSYHSITNGLGTNSNSGSASYRDINDRNPYSWSWSSCMSDMFWIPSHYEVYNTSTSSYSFNGGLWGLSDTDLAFTDTGLDNNATVYEHCWLRSGNSFNNGLAMRVDSSGSADSSRVYNNNGVRPAAHLSLSALEDALPPQYTISVTSNNTTYGTVSTSGGTYYQGTTLSVTATPNPNYQFVRWDRNGTQVSTSPTYEITVSGNDTYTAIFEPIRYTITITTNSENYGKILYNNSLITSTQVIQDSGTQISNLYAISSAGYAFLYWLDSATGQRYTANPLTYTVSADNTLTAIFGSSVAGGVAVVAENGGEVRMSGYDENDATTMHVSAVAYKGYKFLGWYIMGEETPISTELSTDLALSQVQNKIIIARFIPIENLDDMNSQTDNNQTTDIV